MGRRTIRRPCFTKPLAKPTEGAKVDMHKIWRLAALTAGCALLPVSIALADCAAEIEALNAELAAYDPELATPATGVMPGADPSVQLESEQSAQSETPTPGSDTKTEAEGVMPGADPSVTLEGEVAAEVAALRDEAAGAAASGDEAGCLDAVERAKKRLKDAS
jgi:hypothetical protein